MTGWLVASSLWLIGIFGFAAVEDWYTPRKVRAVVGVVLWPVSVTVAFLHGIIGIFRGGVVR